MKLHRFFVEPDELELTASIWVNNQDLLHQWRSVLRFSPGMELVLFNGQTEDRLYRVDKIEPKAVHLKLVTELIRHLPLRDVTLCFSLLKKDKNEWVVQKATELGTSHITPIISSRTEKLGFDIDRMKKIAVEASEQCGRSDIPALREPIPLKTMLEDLNQSDKTLWFAEQDNEEQDLQLSSQTPHVVFVGPEGGWTDEEKELLGSTCRRISLSTFTLRAETACITAVSRLLQ